MTTPSTTTAPRTTSGSGSGSGTAADPSTLPPLPANHLSHPENWATGGEPATDSQKGFIKVLEDQHPRLVPAGGVPLGELNKSGASEVIDKLKNGEQVQSVGVGSEDKKEEGEKEGSLGKEVGEVEKKEVDENASESNGAAAAASDTAKAADISPASGGEKKEVGSEGKNGETEKEADASSRTPIKRKSLAVDADSAGAGADADAPSSAPISADADKDTMDVDSNVDDVKQADRTADAPLPETERPYKKARVEAAETTAGAGTPGADKGDGQDAGANGNGSGNGAGDGHGNGHGEGDSTNGHSHSGTNGHNGNNATDAAGKTDASDIDSAAAPVADADAKADANTSNAGETQPGDEAHLEHPENWATGDQPATDKQKGFIKVLEKQKSAPGAGGDVDNLDKTTASETIEELKSM